MAVQVYGQRSKVRVKSQAMYNQVLITESGRANAKAKVR